MKQHISWNSSFQEGQHTCVALRRASKLWHSINAGCKEQDQFERNVWHIAVAFQCKACRCMKGSQPHVEGKTMDEGGST